MYNYYCPPDATHKVGNASLGAWIRYYKKSNNRWLFWHPGEGFWVEGLTKTP